MEFHNMQSSAPARATQSAAATATAGGRSPKGDWNASPMWLRVMWIILLFAATAIIISLLALICFGGPSESNYINKSDQQAVFLTNGQVYFGKLKSVNRQYLTLQGIYYLNVNQQVQPNQSNNNSSNNSNQSVSLVKLGCELHGPTDQMVINHDQVTFWENLKSDGQVAKAISQWVKQNPNGQTCSTSSTSNSTSNTTNNNTKNGN